MQIDLTPKECEHILESHHYGHLGCIDDHQPYVIPITYVYSEGFMYGFSLEGHKIDIMRKNPNICIQVERVESGIEWESVLCWGLFEEVTDPKNIQDIKLLLAEQHGQSILKEGKMTVSPMVKNLQKQIDESIIYRMKPHKMTGKAER